MMTKTITLLLSLLPLILAESESELDFVGFTDVATMPYSCSDMTATSFDFNFDTNGPRIYLVGGCIENQVCEYVDKDVDDSIFCYCPTITDKCIYFTPETLTWKTCSDAPIPRYRHMAAKVGTALYLLGGRDVDDALIKTIDRFDASTDTWTTPFNWEDAVSDAAAFAFGTTIFVVGGYDSAYETLSQLVSLDTVTGDWSTSWPSMEVGRGDLSVAAFGEGMFYVVGGWNAASSNGWCQPSNVVEIYDAVNNEWLKGTPLNNSRGDLAVGVMAGSLFAVGGETKDQNDTTCTYSVPVKYVERLPNNETGWDDEEDIPNHLFRFTGVAYNNSDAISKGSELYTSAIYLFGGQGTFDAEAMTFPVRNSTVKYIPASTVTSSGGSDSTLSEGGIAGVTIAAIVVAVVVGVGVLLYMEHRRRGYVSLQEQQTKQMNIVPSGEGHSALEGDDMEDEDTPKTLPFDGRV